MSKVNNFVRINKEDYDQEDQPLVESLSRALTPFLEQVYNALNKGIDFDNLNQHYTFFTIRQKEGKPTLQTQLKNPLKTRLKGLIIVSAENITDGVPLTTAPFPNYTVNGDLITITSVAGIPDDKNFRFSVVLIG